AGGVTIELARHGQPRIALPAQTPLAVGDAVTLGIRPEHFGTKDDEGARLRVAVDVIEHLGATSYVYAGTQSGEQVIIERERSDTESGRETLDVTIPSSHTYLFDASGQRIR